MEVVQHILDYSGRDSFADCRLDYIVAEVGSCSWFDSFVAAAFCNSNSSMR